jgi:hypothetical protein
LTKIKLLPNKQKKNEDKKINTNPQSSAIEEHKIYIITLQFYIFCIELELKAIESLL